MAEIEAKARLPYDPTLSELDLRKRKVTDTKENSRVHLPKPVSIKSEAHINVREVSYEQVFNLFFGESCNEKGKQAPNLSPAELRGLNKLLKRIQDGSVVIMETDKSGRLAIATIEAYEEMGQPHIAKDREVDQDEDNERGKYINGNVAMLLKVTSMGQDWRHEERHRESHIHHNGFVAEMCLLLKDHKNKKEGEPWPTRAVVGANQGITASMSNIVSEMLEPLADSLPDKMEIISTEDGLSRINDCNDKLAAEWTPEDIIGLIGADVKAMFASMSAKQTARVVRDVFLESDLEFKGINYQSAAMYVRYGMTDAEIRSLGLTRVVPVRRYSGGRAPGFKTNEAGHKESEMRRTGTSGCLQMSR